MSLHDWQLSFYDYFNNPLGLGFRFSKIKIIERFNDVGVWSYKTYEPQAMWDLLNAGAYKVNILRDSDIFMSGFIRTVSGDDYGTTDFVEIQGVDQLFYLDTRVVYPSTDGDFTADDYDDRTGNSETIVKGYIDDHASAAAVVPARRWPLLTTEIDFGRGDNVTAEGRFQNLLEFCSDIFASGGGLGMRVINDEFQVYTPRDLTDDVILSGSLNNISKRKYRFDNPEANYIIAGGAGDLMARIFYYADDAVSTTAFGRIEKFVDTKNDSGAESAEKHLEEGLSQYSINITPDANDPEFTPYDDYWVGDTITANVFDTNYANVVRSGTVTIDAEKGNEEYKVDMETILPRSQNPFRTIRIREMMNSSRISSQERN